MNSSDISVQSAVADEVNRRLEKATRELEAKYSHGTGAQSSTDLDNGPTGSAYKEKYAQEQKLKKEKAKSRQETQSATNARLGEKGLGDEEDGGDDDEDSELRELREMRLKQIKNDHRSKLENLSKGHGQYREVLQDEFLSEVTGSMRVVCHFYHQDFPRCKIIDHHISKIVGQHIETKFIKVDAEKAPFFIDKLKIRTIPTLVLFVDGVAVDKILGFEGLSDGMPAGKEDEFPTIGLSRLLAMKNIIDKANIIDEEENEKMSKAKFEELRMKSYSQMMNFDDDELDLDD